MAFVVTSGELQAVQRDSNYVVGSPWRSSAISLSPTLTMTYGQIWKAQPAVRSVTSFLARSLASLPVDPYRRLDGTDREKATDHPLAALLEAPMGVGKWTKYRLFNTLMLDLLIYDAAYWLKMVSPSGEPQLQPIPPTRMTPRGGNIFAPAEYRITGSTGYRDYPPDRVVHFHGYNPDDHRTGCAPIETLRQILAEEYSATAYREQMWRNGARTSGYITRPLGAKWSDGAQSRFVESWKSQFTGDGSTPGGTPLLEDGMTFANSGVTPRDAQYVESRKLTREEVAVQYHVSPVMMGIIEGSTISSVMELHKMLYQDTLPPWLTSISQDIENQLLPDLRMPGEKAGSIYVEFNINAKLAGSFLEQASALQSAVGGPYLLRNEARGMSNFGNIDGGDELIVPLNVVAGGLASPNDTAPNNPDNGPSNGQPPKGAALATVLRKHFGRQARVIGSQLGAKADGADLLDTSGWDVQLTADVHDLAPGLPVKAINDETRAALVVALAAAEPLTAVAALFATYADVRAEQIARDWETP